MDWYDFRLQYMWIQVKTINEARTRGVEEPMQLPNPIPSPIPINLLAIPCTSPLAITYKFTVIFRKKTVYR